MNYTSMASSARMQLFLAQFGLRRFLSALNYFRILEYILVLKELALLDRERCLDVGSGHSMFPIYILLRSSVIMHVVDDESCMVDSMAYYKVLVQHKKLSPLYNKRLFVHREKRSDRLSFPDEYFDKISCVSVLEHIPGDGDTCIMKEMVRILKPGGRIVVTVPLNVGGYEEHSQAEYVGYFERKYDLVALRERLIKQFSVKVLRVAYFGERFPRIGKWFNENKLRYIHWVLPFISPFLWKVYREYASDFIVDDQEVKKTKNIGAICITLEKKI